MLPAQTHLMSPDGQRHDRIPHDAAYFTETAAVEGPAPTDDRDPRAVEISAGQRMLSALSGSVLTSLLAAAVTPLDVVRVRLQSQSTPSTSFPARPSPTARPFTNLSPQLGISACCREVFWINNNAQFCLATPSNGSMGATAPSTLLSASECAAEEIQRRSFTSTFDGLRKIARHEGITTLWRGLSPTLVMAVPANVIYFTGYDWLRYNSNSPLAARVPDAYSPLLAGSLARVAAAVTISPIEMFRTRLQASSTNNHTRVSGTRTLYIDTLKTLKDMTQSQGYTSLWRGLTLTLWRDVPFSGLYWWGYETIHRMLKASRTRTWGMSLPEGSSHTASSYHLQENHTTTLLDSFVAGAASGAIASIVTMPFDVGKTRQQVVQHSGDLIAGSSAATAQEALSPERRSMARFLWHIFRHEGLSGLWRGCTARVLKVAPACAIMISSYEVGKKMARGMNEPVDE
ncbi:MAG: hypothetical protein M1823_000381 [Watsoniomyces obsoletus]|nr:MAG: hypothetical protein M1823_000381 [Watsoniomyces obsoletus]